MSRPPLPTAEEFARHIADLTARPGWRAPAAYALGVATVADTSGKVLDTYFPVVNHGENDGFAALLADVCGAPPSGTHVLDPTQLAELRSAVAAVADADHPNAAAVSAVADLAAAPAPGPTSRVVVATFIDHLDVAPVDTHDAYLRLHLLSARAVRPHGCNLDGLFGLLNNVVWTDIGPFDPDGFEQVRLSLRAAGHRVTVLGVDKFPQMLDYVVPAGVRIATASRVRLGAYLGEGTTVMHEGFVNFNAGTEGPAMVEGRISAGVFVGANSDIGGGASIMGTLSGGGKQVVSIGTGCLVGANAGLGISLGDNCVVEAGLYLTAGTVVTLPDGSRCKAAQLTGRDDMLFRRNSVSGAVEMLPQSAEWGGLNTDLHAND